MTKVNRCISKFDFVTPILLGLNKKPYHPQGRNGKIYDPHYHRQRDIYYFKNRNVVIHNWVHSLRIAHVRMSKHLTRQRRMMPTS